MFIIVLALFVTQFVNSFYIPRNNNTAEEIQNAICHISSKELEATANATVTRQLKGVCTSEDFHSRIDKLEELLLQKIDNLTVILESFGFFMHKNESNINFNNSEQTYKSGKVLQFEEKPEERHPNNLEPNSKKQARFEEILKYNDTVNESVKGAKYKFYWNVKNIHELLTKFNIYKSSPNFFILGHSLQLQFFPNYLGRKNFAILLKPQSKGFLKKHKMFILNQYDSNFDLDSGTLYGTRMEDIIFTLSLDNIKKEGYIVDDKLIVGLEIYLDT